MPKAPTYSQMLHYEMVQDAVNSSALVRSRKYNKERGQLMSHSRKNSLLFDMRAHVLRRRRRHTADRADNMQWINSLFAIYILSGLYGRPGFHFVYLYLNCENLLQTGNLFNSHMLISLLRFQPWLERFQTDSYVSYRDPFFVFAHPLKVWWGVVWTNSRKQSRQYALNQFSYPFSGLPIYTLQMFWP